MPSLRHNLGKITLFFFSFSLLLFLSPLFLSPPQCGCGKTGLPVPPSGGSREIASRQRQSPSNKGEHPSLPPCCQHHHQHSAGEAELPLPSTARAGRTAWADAGWERGRKRGIVPKKQKQKGK